ncbi:hypothetical protein EPUS_03450 [Endocarpon pusillum Z07020]|uniref:Uncharacterized protein n=1 Tax=Endocarpon pusillum (strain Z07020 / HMAS-L-300199) TaxID=1263415 RepID=U1GHL2_ENDPU|nr:uncharacterized protein EPUS_03450 [Endocarpon pusillum Z07020]ERF71296.1 hypothetical protein EPUS_03450 [Endocarpon pusillum Z07020]
MLPSAGNWSSGPFTTNGDAESTGYRSSEDDFIELVPPNSSSPVSPAFGETITEQINIDVEEDSDGDMRDIASYGEGNPDVRWLQEWKDLNLNLAIASQIEFFKTRPAFNNSSPAYIYFFRAIRRTLLEAKAAAVTIAEDPIATAHLKLLKRYFEYFKDTTRHLLSIDLKTILTYDFRLCGNVESLENMLNMNGGFLEATTEMAFFLCLEEEWERVSTFVQAAKKNLAADKSHASFNDIVSSIKDLQHGRPLLHPEGPLAPGLLEMNYEFTDAIWSQWIEGCISYFKYWTADSTRTIPANDFIRHLSHYQSAVVLFLKHRTISKSKQSILLTLAKNYMSQYRDHAATELETKYAKLKENVKKSHLYLTEPRFWDIAEDLRVLLNEPPQSIDIEAWEAAVPAMLPHSKVMAARNAVNALYKEFQTKRYPEDEVAYLWLLTWRNIKHILPYLTAGRSLNAIRQESGELPATIEARDIAIPFVQENHSQLVSIVKEDNDALYQKDIEELVGKYCTHIDSYVQGKGAGQARIYEQFAKLSNTKRVPFTCLVGLEETLLKPELKPANGPQMVAHRVVMRLNHIMEGPKALKRWELFENGNMRTYRPTSTWVKEQAALPQAAGFNYQNDRDSYSRPTPASSQPQGSGAGGGGDDGDGDDRRNRPSEEIGESSDSDEEIEVVSPGGTKRIEKRKKAKTVTTSVFAETLTKAKLENLAELARRRNTDRAGLDEEWEEDEVIVSGLHPLPADSLDYHRRRLRALRMEERSAVPHAQYPLPESAAPERAAALQIARELADPGVLTEGPRPEDVEHYINPALRLPTIEEENGTSQQVQNAEPHVVRRTLSRIRNRLGSPFFGSSPRRTTPKATPEIPETRAQRARREREAGEATPPVLKRQADKFAVKKSAPRNGKPRHSKYSVLSFSKLDVPNSLGHHRQSLEVRRVEVSQAGADVHSPSDDDTITDPDLPSSDRSPANNSAASVGSNRKTTLTSRESHPPSTNSSAKHSNQENRTPSTKSSANHSNRENRTPSTKSSANQENQENQTPSTNSAGNNPNQENESPGIDSSQENQSPPRTNRQARGNAEDWNSPSPPYQYDNTLYEGSPIRAASTPTPVQGDKSRRSTGRRLPAPLPAGAQAEPSGPNRGSLHASPPGPPEDDGPEGQIRAFNHWVRMELASNNPDMISAYRLFRELQTTQNGNALDNLFEMLRVGHEVGHFNDYVFERNVTFGPEARRLVRRGVPSAARSPRTPPAQTDRFWPGWWNDPLEGTREGINRPGAAWAEPPVEDGEARVLVHRSSPSRAGSRSIDSSYSAVSPSPMRDEQGNIIPWRASIEREVTEALGEVVPRSPLTGASNRGWSFSPNPVTGLPERQFNISINPDNRPSTGPWDLGEPLLVQDPLNPGQLIPSPHFDPAILALISGGGGDDHGEINIIVPRGWRINVATTSADRGQGVPPPSGDAARSSSSSSSSGPSGDQQVTISGPGFAIHQDPPSGNTSVRERSNAPPTLGLIDQPLPEHKDVIESIEKDFSQSSSQAHSPQKSTGSSSTKSKNSREGSSSHHSSGGESADKGGKGARSSNSYNSSNDSQAQSGSEKAQSGSGDIQVAPPTTATQAEIQEESAAADNSKSASNLSSKSNSKSPTPPTNTTQAQPSSSPSIPDSAGEEPWYLHWETSAVVALRAELLRRGIPLRGLRLKQQMIDRLRRDDQENGVGGVWQPPDDGGEEQGEEEEEENMDEDEEAGRNAKGKGKCKWGKNEEKVGKAGRYHKETRDQSGSGTGSRSLEIPQTPTQTSPRVKVEDEDDGRRLLKRRANPFMGNADASVRAVKRQAREL